MTAGFCAALRAYLKSREQPWFLLTCFYGTFALGTLYWTLHLLLRQETPQVFYVSDLAWLASYVFLLALTLTLPDAGERQSRTGLCWLAPVFCLPQFGLYVTYGDLLFNVLMCGLTMLLAWCAVRGLVWAKKTENGRLRRFHGTVLAFIVLEYALWTASCFWVSDTLTNPYFWFDFLLTLVLLLFLPAVRKAVEA
ncbi:MAG: histidine kinase [Oscillibacter sp.]|nr:histidine kinase [Oscillibacter sp.]